MELHTAIVLRASLMRSSTVTLFDSQFGKIQGIPGRGVPLSSGAMITYRPIKKGINYFLQDISLIEMPLEWARENFLFFHHVLELCEHFVPWESRTDNLFALVSFLYSHSDALKSRQAQKRYLQSFYTRVGMFPESQNLSLDQWIAACVRENPQILKFKTAEFLKELDGHEELV